MYLENQMHALRSTTVTAPTANAGGRSERGAGQDRAIKVALRATLVVAAAGFVYLLGLVANAVAGFPMPPVAATRALASLSVLASAPAFLVFIIFATRPNRTMLSQLSVAVTGVFAVLALANRLLELISLTVGPAGMEVKSLDLYAPYSAAQSAEMLAWGPVFGAAALLASSCLADYGRRWAARSLAITGVLSVAAGLTYGVSAIVALPAWVGGVGIGVGGLAWALLWPTSALLFARNLSPQTRPAAEPDGPEPRLRSRL